MRRLWPLAFAVAWLIGATALAAEPEPASEPVPAESPGPEDAPEPATPRPAETLDPEPVPAVDADLAAIIAEIDAGRFGTAVVLCEDHARRPAGLDLETRAACGRAYLGLGDKLRGMGAAELAKKRWGQAAEIDPRLTDDPAFLERMRTGDVPRAHVLPPRPTPPAPDRPSEHRPPDEVDPKLTSPVADTVGDTLEVPEPRVRGPRADYDFGVGLSGGFDGLAALVLGFFADDTVTVEIAVGLVYPIVDTRLRWYGLRAAFTPVLGVGMTTPLGERDHFGLGVERYDALYDLGESIHVDIGVAWTPVRGLDLFVGAAFVTPLDQEHPDSVLFFPQLAAQAMYYF